MQTLRGLRPAPARSRRALFWPGLALAGLLSGALALPQPAGAARPQPLAAARALVDVPLALAGDAAAGAGLIGAGALGLLGDGLSALDDNRISGPLLAGRLHSAVHLLAWSLSQLGTGGFEVLRAVDVERWPEPRAAYFTAAPGAGRFDTAASGVSALALIPWDLAGGLALAALHTAGADASARRLEQSLQRRRIGYVGPSPASPLPAPGDRREGE